jgi:transcriptional regulator with XRE-family HTH domain
VRLARSLRAVTQEALAQHLDVTFQQIQKYEKGTNRIAASRLHAMAQFLSVPVEFFYEGAMSDGDPLGTVLSDEHEHELLRLVLSVRCPENRRLLLDMARVIADRDATSQSANGSGTDPARSR